MRIKLAYICEPQLGGTFTFFLRLRPALARHGIEMRCVTPLSLDRLVGTPFEHVEGVECVGCWEAAAFARKLRRAREVGGQPPSLGSSGEPGKSEAGGQGSEVGSQRSEPEIAMLKAATARLITYLEAQDYKLVMILPGTDFLSANLPAYLPRQIRCVMRVPMMTRGAYAPTQAIAPHLNRIYAVSDRIYDDLTKSYGIARDHIETIYHGIDPGTLINDLSSKGTGRAVQLLYAGRLWDIDKGIFLLPKIMERLIADAAEVHLTVAGHGPDAAELRRRFEKAGVMNHVTMTGGLPLDRMQEQFRAADIFVFPSRFEGLGFAVLEAMAAGCAPVVSDIRGSLRVIVEDGKAGGLARVGDAVSFARVIGELVKNRAALCRLQEKAQQRIRDVFTLEQMATKYAASFNDVLAAPDHRASLCSLEKYEIPRGLKPTWRTLIPRPIKNFIRMWLERMGMSS